jgi:hypothetical protein
MREVKFHDYDSDNFWAAVEPLCAVEPQSETIAAAKEYVVKATVGDASSIYVTATMQVVNHRECRGRRNGDFAEVIIYQATVQCLIRGDE